MPTKTTDVGNNVGDFITNLNEIVNFDPVKKVAGDPTGGVATGATSGTGGSIINSVKMYNVSPASNTPINTLSFSGSQLDDKGAFIQAYANDPTHTSFMEKTREDDDAKISGKNYMEVEVKGGPDGTDTKTFEISTILRK